MQTTVSYGGFTPKSDGGKKLAQDGERCPEGYLYENGRCNKLQEGRNIVKVPERCPGDMGVAANGECVSMWRGIPKGQRL